MILSRWGGAKIESGKNIINFENAVKMTLYNRNVPINHYFRLRGYNGIPRILVQTEDMNQIDSKKEYLMASIKIINAPEWDVLDTVCKIRGRGNSSWKYTAKKSYKVKFLNKKTPFGFAANKDWVLLGNYWDKTLLRWPFMFELSKALDVPYTVNYKQVELFLNGEFVGTYLFTDHIERGKTRVNTEKDGYLIELDGYYKEEPLWFTTDSCNMPFSFKYPDPSDDEIKIGDENYNYIVKYMNEFEKALLNIEQSDKINEYIDMASFAKWYIHEELLGNIDTNQFYYMKNKKSKLEAGPFWDADWSIGAAASIEGVWVKPYYWPPSDEIIWNKHYYYYLLQSPLFRKAVKSEWQLLKPKIRSVRSTIEEEMIRIQYAQKANFERWPILDIYLGPQLTAFGTWEEEVDYMFQFFDERVIWFDKYVSNM